MCHGAVGRPSRGPIRKWRDIGPSAPIGDRGAPRTLNDEFRNSYRSGPVDRCRSARPASRPPPIRRMSRTYQVRTYGCQMNVHDSERLSGMLEDAGYVARSTPGAGRRRGLQHLRGQGERRQQAVRKPGPPGAVEGADPACRSRSAAASRRRTAARSLRGRPRSTSCSAPTTSGRCRPCWNAHGTTPRPSWRSSSRWRSSRRRSRPGGLGLRGLGVDLGGLQQHLHVLHRAVAARQGARSSAGRVLAEVATLVGRRGPRGDPARAERQLLRGRVRRPRRSASCCAPAAGSTGWNGCGSPRRTPRLHHRRDRRDGGDPPTSCHNCPCRFHPGPTGCFAPCGAPIAVSGNFDPGRVTAIRQSGTKFHADLPTNGQLVQGGGSGSRRSPGADTQ